MPTGTLVEGNDQFHDSNWSLEPQPLWERIKLFWHSGTGQPSGPLTWTADSINSVCTDSRWVDPFLSLNNTSFDAPGATIGTPEWREVLIFPRYGVVNAFPPAFTAPPSTGVWSSTFVYVDPDGRARPNGGVKFTTSGSGLTVNDRFNAQIRIDGGVSYLYDVYSFNASTGKYERHAVRAGILSTPGVTLLSLALLAIATMAAGAFFLRRRGVA